MYPLPVGRLPPTSGWNVVRNRLLEALSADPPVAGPDAGEAYCWGSNSSGRPGDGTTTGFTCTSTPVLDGEFGDPSEPASHVPYTVAVDDASGETVLCVRVDDFERTITTSTSPDAVFDVLLDEPSTYAVRPDWPAVPSAACADQGGDRHVDAESFGTRVRLASYSSGTGQAQVCLRADGPVPVGGVLTVDTTGDPGVEPVIETGSNRTACTLNVLSTSQPATVEVTRSPTGDIPASCAYGWKARCCVSRSGHARFDQDDLASWG